ARILVTGCYAERDPDALASLPGMSAVVGNAHKDEIASIVERLFSDGGDGGDGKKGAPVVIHTAMDTLSADEAPPVNPVASVVDRTRPFVKIQDGCDAACTYCVIPEVRGRARSANPARVVEVVESLVMQGYFEIVLTGVHLGTYGHAFDPPSSLASLVRR